MQITNNNDAEFWLIKLSMIGLNISSKQGSCMHFTGSRVDSKYSLTNN